MFINDLLAKILSKAVKGILGTIIHYFIIGFIYDQILVLILLLLGIDKNSTQVTPTVLAISVVLGLGVMALKWIGTIRSYKIYTDAAIIQSMAQLDEIYGRNERKVISDNCRFKFVLSATDPETQKYFSDLVGQRTTYSETLSPGFITPNRSYSEQGVPLIRAEEWANLDKPILLAPKLNPTKLDLAFWDKENF